MRGGDGRDVCLRGDGIGAAAVETAAHRNTHTHTRARAQRGRTALIGAVVNGHADCVRLLLDAGADQDVTDKVRACVLLRGAVATKI